MTIAELIAAARKANPDVRGVVVIHQAFGTDTPFVAVCINTYGSICDPRSWETHPTPEGALADLERQLPK